MNYSSYVKKNSILDEQQSIQSALIFLKSHLSIQVSQNITKEQLEDCSAKFLKQFCIFAKIDAISLNKEKTQLKILSEQTTNKNIPNLFHKFKIDNLTNFDLLNASHIKHYCTICGIQSQGDKDTLIARLNQFMKSFNHRLDADFQFLLNCYVYVKEYACVPIFLYKAIRTNDFDLAIGILKDSVKLFQTGKPLYLTLVRDFLFSYEYLLPPFFKELMEQMWVIKTDTTNGFVALDEYMEMKHNKYLKKAVKVADANVIEKLSDIANVTMKAIDIFCSLLGVRRKKNQRKSEDFDWKYVDKLSKMEVLPKGLHFSSLFEMGKTLGNDAFEKLIADLMPKIKPQIFHQ